MTRWTVEASDGHGWDVVRWQEGVRVTTRARFQGLACIEARVIAHELNEAFALGMEAKREEVYQIVFGE